MAIDYKHFKEKLEAEKIILEKELTEVGVKNPDNPSDWEAVASEGARVHADDNLAADEIEEYDAHLAIVKTLETRYRDIKNALEKIWNKTYGTCQVCGEEIEQERLEANPSANTCRKHME